MAIETLQKSEGLAPHKGGLLNSHVSALGHPPNPGNVLCLECSQILEKPRDLAKYNLKKVKESWKALTKNLRSGSLR